MAQTFSDNPGSSKQNHLAESNPFLKIQMLTRVITHVIIQAACTYLGFMQTYLYQQAAATMRPTRPATEQPAITTVGYTNSALK